MPATGDAQPAVIMATDWTARLEEYARKLVGVPAITETVPVALFDHVRDFPHEWGQKAPAFAERFGSQYGQFFLDQTIQLGMWSVHKEDSHYFRSGQGNFFRRTGHALRGTLIVPNTSGGETFAFGAVAGSYGSWAIATWLWEPRSEQTSEQVLLWGSAGLLGKAASNFFHEFWPDARHKLFEHHHRNALAASIRGAVR